MDSEQFVCCDLNVEDSATASASVHNLVNTKVTTLCAKLDEWMTNLPKKLRGFSIFHLAIPGSHASFSYDVSPRALSPHPNKEMKKSLHSMSSMSRKRLNGWTKAQTYDVEKQLTTGIRYLELTVATRRPEGELYFVHGQYATTLSAGLGYIKQFLELHKKEVVILDFQHFYECEDEDFAKIEATITNTFEGMLVPNMDSKDKIESLTLEYLTEKNHYQVLVIYRGPMDEGSTFLWPTRFLVCDYETSTMNKQKLITSLEKSIASRDVNAGHVTQFALAPSPATISSWMFSSVLKKCAKPLFKKKLTWLRQQTPGPTGVNVIVADFIDLNSNSFPKLVVDLNLKLL